MLDISLAYGRFRFLGAEFLTWLWFTLENENQPFEAAEMTDGFLELGNRMVLEKRQSNKNVETITIQGELAAHAEGHIALQKGAKVAEVNLVWRQGDRQWRFNLKGDSLHLTGLKTPESPLLETENDFEAAIIDRIFQIETVTRMIDHLFKRFIMERLTDGWPHTGEDAIRRWIDQKIQ
jgi:hypothetical protein